MLPIVILIEEIGFGAHSCLFVGFSGHWLNGHVYFNTEGRSKAKQPSVLTFPSSSSGGDLPDSTFLTSAKEIILIRTAE